MEERVVLSKYSFSRFDDSETPDRDMLRFSEVQTVKDHCRK